MGMLLAVLSAGVAQSSNSAARGPLLSAEEVVHRLEEKNQERAEALRQFQGTRIYRMQYRGFPSDRDAEMIVKVSYQSPDKKEFTVTSQNGSQLIINHVFKSYSKASGKPPMKRTSATPHSA